MNLPVPDGQSEANPGADGEPARRVEPPADAARPGAKSEPRGSGRPVTRKQLDDIFGDVLPSVTQDELDERDGAGGEDRERWYRDNRPPHHG